MNHGDDVMTIGELAARAGVATSALRFYEAEGLLAPPRTAGNQRRYRRADLRRVSVIRAAQRLGIPLAEVRRAFAALPDGRTPTRADWSRLSRGWRAALERRIAELELLRDRLDGCIGCGCLSLRRCALFNPADRAGREGPGPRYLLAGARHVPEREAPD